jgi:RNA polymerase primary sigma factor
VRIEDSRKHGSFGPCWPGPRRAAPDETEEAAELESSTDSLQLFLKEIGRVDLLTAAQEVELAKRIERGDHHAKQGDD